MTPRPGPLRDLPLERFIGLPFPSVPATPRKGHKRPLSPGTPNLFSPTKKRILAQEGIFSPEKTVKSSIVPSDRAVIAHDFLRHSPARRLDFGQAPQSDGKVASTSRLLEDCFVEPPPKHARSPGQHDRNYSSIPIFGAFPSQQFPIPSSSSGSSENIHYPGFDVWRDCDPSPSSLPTHSSLDAPHASDEDKENMRPRTKRRTGLSTRMKKVSFVSPKQLRRQSTPKIPFTPLNTRNFFEMCPPREITPGKVLKVDGDEMKRRRELLAMELDGDESSEDDI